MAALIRALKYQGVMYCSFKLGEQEREKDGRNFTAIELAPQSGSDLIRLDQLAELFSRLLCEHLQQVDKQGTMQ